MCAFKDIPQVFFVGDRGSRFLERYADALCFTIEECGGGIRALEYKGKTFGLLSADGTLVIDYQALPEAGVLRKIYDRMNEKGTYC